MFLRGGALFTKIGGRIRDVSGTNSNKGIFSNEHEEYTECTKYMAEVNRNAYRLIEYFDKKYGR